LKGDHLRIISAKFGWDWLSSFICSIFNADLSIRHNKFLFFSLICWNITFI
jgi:hypothetical protein